MTGAIRITYRHRYGCPHGDCPGHIAVLRNAADVERMIRSLARAHPERPVELERVAEVRAQAGSA